MKLLDGINDPEILLNLYDCCLEIIKDYPNLTEEGNNEFNLKYCPYIEKNQEIVKNFNSLLKNNPVIFKYDDLSNIFAGLCQSDNVSYKDYEGIAESFFLNLLLIRLKSKKFDKKNNDINKCLNKNVFRSKILLYWYII